MKRATVLATLIALALWPAAAHAAPTPLWQLDLKSCTYGSAAVDDVDGDGDLEVAFGTYYNDERVLVVDAATGAIELALPSGGGPVDNSVTLADVDRDGTTELLWGNSATTLFHVMSPGGQDEWTYLAGEVLDAPMAVADLDGDGTREVVLASCGSESSGGLRVLSGASGAVVWQAAVSGCYQSAPLVFDIDGDSILDVVVSTWFDEEVRAFSGKDGTPLWTFAMGDWMYHAGSFGDLDGDGVPDVAVGDMSGGFFAIDGRDGTQLWSAPLGETAVFGPTAMADLDADGSLEVVVTGTMVHALRANGAPLWTSDYLVYAARGPVIADADGNATPDVIVATDEPSVKAFDGATGAALWSQPLPDGCAADFAPVVWDFDGDGLLDLLVVCGRGYSDPDPEANWGQAVALKGEGTGPGWPTFSHDHHHSGNWHYPPGSGVNDPSWDPCPSCGGGGSGGAAGGAGAEGGATQASPTTLVQDGCACHAGPGRAGGDGPALPWLLGLPLLGRSSRGRTQAGRRERPGPLADVGPTSPGA